MLLLDLIKWKFRFSVPQWAIDRLSEIKPHERLEIAYRLLNARSLEELFR